jgi:lipopolysaccharide biosynthesis glycosyltransferase
MNIFVTITNSSYFIGTLVLNYSLQKNQSKYKLLVLYDTLEDPEISALNKHNILHKKVDLIKNPYDTNRFVNVFCKLYCWTLVEYEKVIYLDNDITNIKNMDHLFDMSILDDKIYGCGSYTGFNFNIKTSILNTGFFLIKPSMKIYTSLLDNLGKLESYDNADQGYLNSYFSNNIIFLEEFYNFFKRRILFYNFYKENIYNIHYVGDIKPWHKIREKKYRKLYNIWIKMHDEMINEIINKLSL